MPTLKGSAETVLVTIVITIPKSLRLANSVLFTKPCVQERDNLCNLQRNVLT